MFWWDNWIQMGSLYNTLNPSPKPGNVKVNSFIINHQWDLENINFPIPTETLNLIKDTPIGKDDTKDKAIWKLSNNSIFSCSSAYESLRDKNVISTYYKKNWIKELPFKVFFYVEAFQEETPT